MSIAHVFLCARIRFAASRSSSLQQHNINTDNSRFVCVYALALISLGQAELTISVLESARQIFPAGYDISWAQTTMVGDIGRSEDARAAAENSLRQFPDDHIGRRMLDFL